MEKSEDNSVPVVLDDLQYFVLFPPRHCRFHVTVCVSSHRVSTASLMYTLRCKELLGNAYSKCMCMDAHTHSVHTHTGGSPPSSSSSGCSI